MYAKIFQAYWISTDGRAIGVSGRHIEVVCRNPQRFGLSGDYVRSVFLKYQEPLGFEGKARQIIMLKLIKKGWIRLRFIRNPYMWKAQLNKFNSKTIQNLILWDKINQISQQDPQIELLIMTNNLPSGTKFLLKKLKEAQNQ